MNIKCPICKKEYDTEKANHYAKVHDELEIGQCLTDLVFKIHELRQDYVIRPEKFIFKSIDDILKSLLENEK